jgi:translation initiation factor 2 gamma subunit (eIF-2gamma)
MNAPTTAREALVAEAIGDAGRLLDRLEQLLPALEGARLALTHADTALVERIDALEARMVSITATTTTEAVEHLTRQARLVAVRAVESQRVAMAYVARRLFSQEVEPA